MSDFSDTYVLQVVRDTRRFWPLGALVFVLTVLAALSYLMLSTPAYDVSMTVAPASQLEDKGSSSLDLGAAAGLLGIRPSASDPRLDRYRELLTSVELARRIDPNGDLFHRTFRGEWDAQAQRWVPPQGAIATWRRDLSDELGAEPWHAPTAATFAALMQRELIISPVGRTNMMRVAMRSKDPHFAVELLGMLNATADGIIRESERTRVVAYRDYLLSQLPNVANEENRRALSQLLLEQERRIMMLNAKTVSYAAELIDPPSLPDQPVGLRPLMILALAVLVGLAAGGGVTYLSAVNTGRRHR